MRQGFLIPSLRIAQSCLNREFVLDWVEATQAYEALLSQG